VVWIPGHTYAEDVKAGKISEENRRGNSRVDDLAKKGAMLNACPRELVEGTAQRKKIGQVLHNGFAAILIERKEAIKDATKIKEEEEEEEP
jgi:hypothetical protein